MRIKSIFSNSSKILIYIFFIATSYAAIFSVSYIDDIVVAVMGVLLLVYLCVDISRVKCIVLAIAALLAVQLANLLISKWICNDPNALDSFWTFTKIIIIFMQPIIIEYETEDKEKILRNVFYLSIPNLLYSCYEIFVTYIQHNYMPGKYDASGMYRLQGFTGHPIFYSLLLSVLLMYLLYFCRWKIRYVLAMVCFMLCMLTWSSLAQVAALLLVMYKLIQYTKVKNVFRRYVSLVLLCLLSGILLLVFASMLKETYTIRYISVMETIKNVNLYNLLVGSGIGSFATRGLSESYIFHIFYDSGLCGLMILGIIVCRLYRLQIKYKNYGGLFVLSVYLLSMFINEGYMVPAIVFVPIVCGRNILRSTDTKILIT